MAETNDIAVSIKGLHKSFRLPHEQHSGIKQLVINRLNGKSKRGFEEQKVIKNLSFDIKKGEFFGIVGRNGGGKSTLLKLLAGIYTPDKGSIEVDGSLVPFIELGVGFNPELTGRENVYLNGALLGFSKKQMDAMYDEIVGFAELERFMDQKLKNYSSGMQVRLAFSIAIRAKSDILVLDEVLAVGDEAFQRKCFSYFAQLKKEKKTVILVTHSMETVQQFCDRAMLIERGKIVVEGNPTKVAQSYSELFLVNKGQKTTGQKTVAQNDAFDVKASYEKTHDKITLKTSLKPKKDFFDPVVGILISRDNGEIVWRWASDDKTPANIGQKIEIKKGKKLDIEIELENILPSAEFTVTVLVRKQDKSEEYARYTDILKFDNYTNSIYEKFWKMREKVKVGYGEK